jgi:hypothetical protein
MRYFVEGAGSLSSTHLFAQDSGVAKPGKELGEIQTGAEMRRRTVYDGYFSFALSAHRSGCQLL